MIVPLGRLPVNNLAVGLSGQGGKGARLERGDGRKLQSQGRDALRFNETNNVERCGGDLQVRFEFKGQCGREKSYNAAAEINLDFITVTWEQNQNTVKKKKKKNACWIK